MQESSIKTYNKLWINFDIPIVNNLDNIIKFNNVKSCKVKFDDFVTNLKYQNNKIYEYGYVDINSHLHSQR